MLGSIGNQLQRSISMQDQGLLSDQRSIKPQFAEHEHLKCPRCDSTNTKFCYYNNYNLSQPRHFCKNCRRYWTKGGALRNIPVGGGSRKNSRKTPKSKHPSSNSTSVSPCSSSGVQLPNQDREISGEKLTGIYSSAVDADQKLLEIPGTFSSLLASNGHFGLLSADPLNSKFPKMQGLKGSVTENLGKNLWGVQEFADNGIGNPPLELQSSNSENFLGLQVDSNCWGGNGWPDLAIYTPGSNLQ